MTTLSKTVPSLAIAAAGSFGGVWQLAQTWQGRRRSRQALARLDAHLLRDIGIEPTLAEAESDRPFWYR